MKVFGILLLVVGLIAAVASIAGVGLRADRAEVAGPVAIVGDQNQPARDQATSLMLPIMAGIAIAAGGVIIGLGMGRFADPKIVPANSPQAEKAATTRGTRP